MQHFFDLKLTKTNTESAEWAGSGGGINKVLTVENQALKYLPHFFWPFVIVAKYLMKFSGLSA